MHQILYQRKRKKIFHFFPQIFLFFRGIFHFVKDNYFRTSSSSSEDEYDSDDSAHKGENATNPAPNPANKLQPVGAPVANVVAAANTGSAQSNGSDGNK
jgi:hypothetical protein